MKYFPAGRPAAAGPWHIACSPGVAMRLLPFLVFCLGLTALSRAADTPVFTAFPDDPACTAEDRKFMARAHELSRLASRRGDSPIGAVLVKDGKIICEFGNTVNTDGDPTMHGETGLIHYASHVLEKSLWEGATLYTSLEPCIMCTGSIHWAGIKTVVYGGTTRQPNGQAWGPDRLRCREVYDRFGWDLTVRGPLMDAEYLQVRDEHNARLAAKAAH
jgi:tRNA(Arg) A34 adenosine deaminase TadA